MSVMLSARHRARARRTSLLAAPLLCGALVGCSHDRIVQPSLDGDVALTGAGGSLANAVGAPVPIEFETYEASRQVVHPSAVMFPSAWHGQRFWLALTPYPNSDSRVENPSLYSSATGDAWAIPAGVTNPVMRTKRGYLSDPELVYDPATDELRLYYREVMEKHSGSKKARHEADVVYVSRSSDGVRWSAGRVLAADAGRYVVSPTVTRRGTGDWQMWSVDAGRHGCSSRETRIIMRRSQDGLTWGKPSKLTFVQPGYRPWHIDMQYVPQLRAYWGLVAAYPAGGSCTGTSLFLTTSSDGVHWTTFPTPLLARGALPQFSTNVYRSTFAFDPDGSALTIWLTGATTVRQGDRKTAPVLRWSAAVWHTNAQAVLAHVSTATAAQKVPADTQPSFLRRLAVDNALP
jgi:hypothetical protein